MPAQQRATRSQKGTRPLSVAQLRAKLKKPGAPIDDKKTKALPKRLAKSGPVVKKVAAAIMRRPAAAKAALVKLTKDVDLLLGNNRQLQDNVKKLSDKSERLLDLNRHTAIHNEVLRSRRNQLEKTCNVMQIKLNSFMSRWSRYDGDEETSNSTRRRSSNQSMSSSSTSTSKS